MKKYIVAWHFVVSEPLNGPQKAELAYIETDGSAVAAFIRLMEELYQSEFIKDKIRVLHVQECNLDA